MKPDVIAQLQTYRQKDKFSEESWKKRGLIPSPKEVSLAMSTLINDCLDEVLGKDPQSVTNAEWQNLLINNLAKVSRMEYDTEEREFLCDCFAYIADLLDIDFGLALDSFMYGADMARSLALDNAPSGNYQLRTQPCDGCDNLLETWVIERAGVPDFSWFVVKCNHCHAYTLLSVGSGIGELKRGNYEFVEQIRKDQFTYAEAQARVAHLRKG
ncbi:DUF4844 domain-containing protein [Xanthocytophaga agilis]|uniref:DUF4844 domain-containing protein n=1 Tax=Xanthocytophaga agilis TaxID=3048010 RepID=A0AAE3R6Z4_9BACT|nr:DUF4844 domain-containing protein [Xanthocytophaga agilis]MDJ1504771.1 DUF4844 domain-containing protein [Xanthocytophaga agilis]